MTDNEIIKALEEHYKQVDKGYSTHLEYGGKGDEHEEKYIYMLRDVLDLINRQKAEIDYWKRNAFDGCMERGRIEKTAKAEAYKEFAERLKDTKFKHGNEYIIYAENVDNLLKEKVGAEE